MSHDCVLTLSLSGVAKCLFCAETLAFLAKSVPLAVYLLLKDCFCCFVTIICLDNYTVAVSVSNILTASQSNP